MSLHTLFMGAPRCFAVRKGVYCWFLGGSWSSRDCIWLCSSCHLRPSGVEWTGKGRLDDGVRNGDPCIIINPGDSVETMVQFILQLSPGISLEKTKMVSQPYLALNGGFYIPNCSSLPPWIPLHLGSTERYNFPSVQHSSLPGPLSYWLRTHTDYLMHILALKISPLFWLVVSVM